jgi:hypothetical protein
MNQQQSLEYLKGMMENGMSVADANVELIRMTGVRLVTGKIPKDVRSALMAGVKDGRIGRLAKEGHKPEAFFHPNSIWNAKEARNKAENNAIRALLAICA